MATQLATSGFVFKKEDIGEADRFFSVFTEDFGRVNVFARAIKKSSSKLKSQIDIFSFVDIEFVQGKSKKTLTDAMASQKFNRIVCSPKRFEVSNRIAMAIDEIIKDQERDTQLLSFIKEVFTILDSEKLRASQCDVLYYYFLWNYFCILGFRPELSRCSHCSCSLDPKKLSFSCKEGGVTCSKCQGLDKKFKKIGTDIVKILRIITSSDWNTFSRVKIGKSCQKELQEISNEYYFYLADK
ncbi:MAG TPA: DNA repair protein RecO [Candidatus Staskawiczbacteria bacterium]|nr:DNA repair protein RecO [Candidatus Staskawiczbacteria bacterium]